MSKRSGLGLLMALIGIVGLSGWWLHQVTPQIRVQLCLPKTPASGLPILAANQNYFQKHGLRVEIQVEEMGKTCVDKLISGQVDLTSSSIQPIVAALTQGHHLMLLTELTTSNRNTSLVFPKTSGSGTNPFLKGRNVGLVKGTNSETFLRLYLKGHDIDAASIEITEAQSLKDLGEKLYRSEVDAAVMWEPFLSQFLASGKADRYLTQDSPFYSAFCVLASSREYATTNFETVQKFIKALDEALGYAESNREEAHQTVMAYFNYSQHELPADVWAKFRMNIGLSAVLISMMQEAQKPFVAGPGFENHIPQINVFQALYPQALRHISKDLVTYE